MKPSELERVYESLAECLDKVPAAKRELFLAKLVLLLADGSNDLTSCLAMINAAASNLDV